MPRLDEESGGKVKPSGYHQEYTTKQIEEILRCAEDPIYFIREYVYIQHPTRGALKFDLFDFQEDLIQCYDENRLVIGLLSRQVGKALALDTPIPTPTGWTTMGDIRVGDMVVGKDGKSTKVTLATDVMYNHACYKIEFDNGEEIVADADHRWVVSSKISKHESQIVTTSDMIDMLEKTQHQGQGLYIELANPIEKDEKTLPISPYTFGIWIGDGDKNSGRFTSSVEDFKEIKSIIEQEGYKIGNPCIDRRRDNTQSQTIYGLRPILRDMGVLHNKQIPEVYLNSSVEQRLELLKGLMDSDGYASKNGRCEFYQRDYRIAQQVFEVVASLGMKPRLKCKNVNDIPFYTVLFTTTKYSVFNLSRKKDRQTLCHGHIKNTRYYIKSITSVQSVPVRCIQVDNNDHMFLCGKSMIPTHNTATAAAYLLWYAIFKPDQQILIASKDHDGAKDIMGRLWYAYEELPWWIKPGCTVNQVHTKEFDNNSKIFATATTATSGRGKSNSLIYLDEFAFVRPGVANEFWTAIFPTIATGGKCIITSTPNTDEDKFASIWFNATRYHKSDVWKDVFAERQMLDIPEDNDEEYNIEFETSDARTLYGSKEEDLTLDDDESLEGFVGFHAHWTKVPDMNGGFRNEKFKRQILSSGITEEEWLREYECAFVSGDSTLIAASKMATFRQTVRKPLFIDKWGMRWYEHILPNQIYGVVLDPSEGVNADDACIQVWEIPRMKQVAEWNNNSVDQPEQARMLRRTLKRIYMIQMNDIEHIGGCQTYYSVERNGLGIGILNSIEYEGEMTFPGFLLDSTMTSINVRGSGMETRIANRWRGLLTSVSSKKRYAIEFKNLVERNLFIVRSKHLASQLKTFVKSGPSWAAKEGAKDDIVMSCVLMCHLVDEIRYHEPDLDDLIRPDLDDYDVDDFDHPDNMALPPVVHVS